MSIYATRRWHICLKSAEEHWANTEVMEHCLTMSSVAKFCTSGVRLRRHWNGSTTASTWWITADKHSIFLEGVKFTACPIFICCKIIVPLWIETRTAYKWVINVRTLLYAVCLSSTFSSVAHFRCRLHFWVQTLKGERFLGWILSAGGRFCPKRLAAWPFNFQGLLYYLRRRAKEMGDWRNRETHNIADWW